MRPISILPAILESRGKDGLIFESPNGLKALAFQTWVGFGVIFGLCYFAMVIKAGKFFTLSDLEGRSLFGDLTLFFLLSIPVFFFFVWLFVKPTSCLFNRASKSVHYKSHRHDFSLPWRQIRFQAQWFPSKTGVGGSEFFVLGDPPFPASVLPKSPKRLRKLMNMGGGTFNFGTFSLKSDDEFHRWQCFFTAFMETSETAEDLYRHHILAGGLGNRFSGLVDL